jgi:hypothetical protein
MSGVPEDDDLEVIDLEPVDEQPSRIPRERRPKSSSRPRPSRRALAGVVAAALVVGTAGGYLVHRARGTSAHSTATRSSAPDASFAPGRRLPPNLGGAPLLGLASGHFALVVGNRLWLIDAASGGIRSVEGTGRDGVSIGPRSGKFLLTAVGPEVNLLDVTDLSVTRLPSPYALFPGTTGAAWLQGNGTIPGFVGGFILRVDENVAPAINYPAGTEPLAQLRNGILLRDPSTERTVVWRPGTDLQSLPALITGDATIIATDPTHVVYAPPCASLLQCAISITDVVRHHTVTVPYADGDTLLSGRFSPDGTRLALSVRVPRGPRVAIIDTASGAVLAQPPTVEVTGPDPGFSEMLRPVPFTWTADGTVLLVVQETGTESRRQVSSFLASDGRFVRAFNGVVGLDQIVALPDQPTAP